MKKSNCPFSYLSDPKGPASGLSIFFIAYNALKFLLGIREKYGDVAQYKMLGITNYLISNPKDISQVFKDEKNGLYKKTWFHKAFYSFFGNGLFNSYGDDWKEQRKKLQPFFNKVEVTKWFPLITKETLKHFKPVKETTSINAEDIIKPLMQGIMSRILFGLNHDNRDSKQAIDAIEEVSKQLANYGLKTFIFNGFLNKLPTPGNLKYKKALEIIDSSINKMSKNSDTNKDQNALLPMFSKIMSSKELRDQLTTLYFAGQETTVSTLLWAIYYLAKYPEHQEKARNEVLNEWKSDSNLDFKDLDSFVFLNAAIDESMRLSPVAFMMSRDIDNDVQLGKYKLEKDSLVMLSTYVTNRHPELWENPLKYDPNRFLDSKNKGYSFFPYGGGMRMCIGMHLARMEITTIMALFITQYRFELEPGIKIRNEINLTLKPKNGIPLNISPL
jgi:cytochrome P450